jgi:surface protein
MRMMFQSCSSLNCDLSKWDVSNVTSMEDMFSFCGKLNCDLSKWDVRNATSMEGMFSNCTNFDCDLSKWKWKLRSDINMTDAFKDCPIADEHKFTKLSGIEVRYNIVTWLYRIRKQNGRKYGFLQPDFICIIFGTLIPSNFLRDDSVIGGTLTEFQAFAALQTDDDELQAIAALQAEFDQLKNENPILVKELLENLMNNNNNN